jgi:zinc D-Ala-D-Ala carboxypeptidase
MHLNKKLYLVLSIVITILIVVWFIFIYRESANAPVSSQKQETATATAQEVKTPEKPISAPTFDKNKYSLTEPTSLWIVVNKKRPLPSTYVPNDLTSVLGGQLRAEAANSLKTLVLAGKNNGHNLSIISSYRSYNTQTSTYNGYVVADGVAKADTYSARPGHSEHQSGLAVDLGNGVCNLEICFADTSAGKWLATNAPDFGFVVRYPSGKESITGYQYEPWHLRYVGIELAKELQKANQTMEEFFGLTNQSTY